MLSGLVKGHRGEIGMNKYGMSGRQFMVFKLVLLANVAIFCAAIGGAGRLG
jgi:hypothetical protein